MKRFIPWTALLACGCLILLTLLLDSSVSKSLSCHRVHAIFARGSGQELGKEEWTRFDQQLKKRLKSVDTPLETYELGTTPQNGHQYPAVDISLNSSNSISAWSTSGTGGAYGRSVSEGTLELGSYLIKLHQQCPQSHVVLGGYSQGAQVIGQAVRSLPRDIRDMIVFSALFGDPKLFLPEGEGLVPPACLRKDPSPWRRDVPNCNVSSGVLGARNPYLPQDMQNKTGLWCLEGDVICGSWENFSFNNSHGDYKNTSGAIDKAAQEIASRLSLVLPDQNVKTVPDVFKVPDIVPSIMFLFDNSATMTHERYNDVVKPKIDKIVDKKSSWSNGLGFLTYYGGSDQHNISFHPPKSTTGSEVRSQLEHMALYPSETNLSQDLVDSLTWLQRTSLIPASLKKGMIVILFTNTPFEPTTAMRTYEPRLASTQDDMVIYPVVPSSIRNTFSQLSIAGSQVIIPGDDIEDSFLDTVKNPQLIAELAWLDYMAPPGTTLEFDASASSVYDDTITTYEWDFEGDGVYDQTTTTPTISHRYDSISTSMLTVRVTTASGLIDTAQARVRIIDPATLPPIPKAPLNLKLERTSATTVRLTWEAADNLADTWIIAINDFPLGRVKKDQLFINISEVDSSVENIFSVRALSAQYKQSEAASVKLTSKTPSSNLLTRNPDNALSANDTDILAKILGSILDQNPQTKHLNSPPKPSTETSFSREKAPLLIYICIGIASAVVVGVMLWSIRLFIQRRKSTP